MSEIPEIKLCTSKRSRLQPRHRPLCGDCDRVDVGHRGSERLRRQRSSLAEISDGRTLAALLLRGLGETGRARGNGLLVLVEA